MSAPLFPDDVLFTQRLLKCASLYDGPLDGVWTGILDAAADAFEATCEASAAALGRFDPRSERNIRTLLPVAQGLARRFLARAQAGGRDIRVISGTRTYAAQDALFRMGRFGNPPPRVTNARGGQSNHNFGIAWDIGVFDAGAYLPESPVYSMLGEEIVLPGLEWGGNWTTFQDRPHFQLATGLPITTVRTRFEHGEPYA
jgi:peptidoglycan L-alanyl-D-glutamate endopeptidase CwlK